MDEVLRASAVSAGLVEGPGVKWRTSEAYLNEIVQPCTLSTWDFTRNRVSLCKKIELLLNCLQVVCMWDSYNYNIVKRISVF